MKIHIDIRNDIPTSTALQLVKNVVDCGRISGDGKYYCYATNFDTHVGKVWVYSNPHRKSDCFIVEKEIKEK